jgi:hypothetical protein
MIYGILTKGFLILAEMRKPFKSLESDEIILLFLGKHNQYRDISWHYGVVNFYSLHYNLNVNKMMRVL